MTEDTTPVEARAREVAFHRGTQSLRLGLSTDERACIQSAALHVSGGWRVHYNFAGPVMRGLAEKGILSGSYLTSLGLSIRLDLDVSTALTLSQGSDREWPFLPKQIGRLGLGDKPTDNETYCNDGHVIPDGSPIYWPYDMSEYDDRNGYCLEHAIGLAESDSSWCQVCISRDLAAENLKSPNGDPSNG